MQVAVRRFGFDDTDPLTTWINASLHEFEDAFFWPFLQVPTTIPQAADDNEVVLPSDFFKPILMKITDPSTGTITKVSYKDEAEYTEEVDNILLTPSKPTHYIMRAGVMLLQPTPNVAYDLSLTYQKYLPDLVDADDVPGIPLRWHYLICRGAAAIGLEAENEEERAEQQFDKFYSGIERAMGNSNRTQLGEFGTVRNSDNNYSA